MMREIRAERARRDFERERERVARDAEGIRERCKTLRGFVREAWHVLEPSTPYLANWHHDAICEHLEAITKKQITRLQINQPPATMKSLIASVMWEAWEWGPAEMPGLRYLTTSYTETYARRDSRKMRDLVLSEWYQALWPEVVLTRDNETDFENTAKGGRRAMPFASLTAGRGNRVVIDDPHSTESVESPADRQKVIRIFRESVTSRLNDPIHDAILVIMHRLRTDDVCGVIEQIGLDYVKLILPMEYDPKRVSFTPFFKDPRTQVDELLCPERLPRETIEMNKIELGSHAYATQYQQRPASREGGMFKRHWFHIVDAVPADVRKRVRRWDLAASLPTNGSDPDWTAGVRMSGGDGKFYVEDVVRLRDVGAKVRKAIKNTATVDGRLCHIVVPQDPGQAGKDQAASIIGENAGYRITAERETGDKGTRAEPFAAQLEAGNVYLLRGTWNEAFIEELCSFPQGNDDQVDAASGAFNHLAGVKGPMIISAELLAKSRQPGPRR
jgi:predicted phage terminase large subunit-like protein